MSFKTADKPQHLLCPECKNNFWQSYNGQLTCDTCESIRIKNIGNRAIMKACKNEKCNNHFWEGGGFDGFCCEVCKDMSEGKKLKSERRLWVGGSKNFSKKQLIEVILTHPQNRCSERTLSKESMLWLKDYRIRLTDRAVKKINKERKKKITKPTPSPKHKEAKLPPKETIPEGFDKNPTLVSSEELDRLKSKINAVKECMKVLLAMDTAKIKELVRCMEELDK